MADEIKAAAETNAVATPVEAKPVAKKAVKAVKAVKADAKEEAKAVKVDAKETKAAPKKSFAKPVASDYNVILTPLITEKSMANLQNANKVTIKVAAGANKIAIKESFQRLYQVEVSDVKVMNQRAKATTRGSRYHGEISGFKKAIVTVKAGQAIDLFKE